MSPSDDRATSSSIAAPPMFASCSLARMWPDAARVSWGVWARRGGNGSSIRGWRRSRSGFLWQDPRRSLLCQAEGVGVRGFGPHGAPSRCRCAGSRACRRVLAGRRANPGGDAYEVPGWRRSSPTTATIASRLPRRSLRSAHLRPTESKGGSERRGSPRPMPTDANLPGLHHLGRAGRGLGRGWPSQRPPDRVTRRARSRCSPRNGIGCTRCPNAIHGGAPGKSLERSASAA